MQTISYYIYEHDTISPELQKSIKNGKNIFINMNNQVLWIHEDSMDYFTITNMETKNNIIQIPIVSYIKHNNSKYNVILYDDNTLWIGRNSIVSYDKIWYDNKYYKAIPNYKNEVFIIDLVNVTYKNVITNFDITNLNPIGQKYFTVKTEELLLVFHWSDLLTMNEELKPINTFPPDITIYPVNWQESSICKITEGSTNFEFLDEHFNIMFNVHINDIFKKYKPIETQIEDDDIMTMVSVNDNCFVFLECRELVEERSHIIEPGLKNVYCFDLTNNTEITFENGEIEHFIENIIPYRYNGRVKYIAYEWYPAGDWVKHYDSLL
jgi:hypothetical protein